jgi:hypothetical protein
MLQQSLELYDGDGYGAEMVICPQLLLKPSRGRGTGFATPQAQRPLGGQGATRSE